MNLADGIFACLQIMLPSNVQGGFWQQLPSEMQVAWAFEHSTRIELECEGVSKKEGEWFFQVHSLPCKVCPYLSARSLYNSYCYRTI